jgi:anaerobic selenocysteine-containing dehydrogenase
MKLQKRLSRIYKEKRYYKYILTIPEKDIKRAGFKEGDEIQIESKVKEIKLKN